MREFGFEPIVFINENDEIPIIDKRLQKNIQQGIIVLKTPIWEPYNFYKKFIGRKKEDKINASFLSENKKACLYTLMIILFNFLERDTFLFIPCYKKSCFIGVYKD